MIVRGIARPKKTLDAKYTGRNNQAIEEILDGENARHIIKARGPGHVKRRTPEETIRKDVKIRSGRMRENCWKETLEDRKK